MKEYFFDLTNAGLKEVQIQTGAVLKKFRKNRVIVGNFDMGWEFPWYRPRDRKYFFGRGKMVIPYRYLWSFFIFRSDNYSRLIFFSSLVGFFSLSWLQETRNLFYFRR